MATQGETRKVFGKLPHGCFIATVNASVFAAGKKKLHRELSLCGSSLILRKL